MANNNENDSDKSVNPVFIIDASVLQEMFEGSDKSKELFHKMLEIKQRDNKFCALTTSPSFLRAIFLCSSDTNINLIQKCLTFLEVCPSLHYVDFKDSKAVMEDLLQFAKMINHDGVVSK